MMEKEQEGEMAQEIRGIISRAFLGEDENISKENFDLAVNGCVDYAAKLQRRSDTILWMLGELPENTVLSKDSGLWRLYNRDYTNELYSQAANESFSDFIQRIFYATADQRI